MKTSLFVAVLIGAFCLAAYANAQTPTRPATFDLSWTDNSSGAAQEDGTEIEAGPKAGPFVRVGVVGQDVTKFAHTIANDPGKTELCFRVRAFNATGVSGYSTVACGTTPEVKLVANTPGDVKVSVSVTVTVTQ